MDQLSKLSLAKKDFRDFIRIVFPASYRDFKPAKHLFTWGNRIQNNKKTATLSARKHLKSTLMYAYLMWRIFKMEDNEEWLYMSYTEPLSQYHTKNIKKLIQNNPFFKGLTDLTTAESIIKVTWDKAVFSIQPASISRFNRGWHGYGVVCDDILADPENELNLTVIDTITNTFFEEVLSLPIEGGELHLVGTAQHQEDLFFRIKDRSKSFDWAMYPAIKNEIDGTVLWPELFDIKRLIQIRDEEIGEKAFNKEYLCSPVWSEEAYFKRDEIINCVDTGINNLIGISKNEATVFAGFDIGKVRHPSFFTIFLESDGYTIQVYQIFMDQWDYTKQIEFINALVNDFKIKKIYYDATRGEMEGFVEQHILPKNLWIPVNFTAKEKFNLAANFGSFVRKGKLKLQNSQRMIRSILSVNNDLDAVETKEGHGDAFWGIALALSHKHYISPAIFGVPRNR